MNGIRGAVCLVSGAAQGIGEAVARGLAARGAVLALLDVNAAALFRLSDELAGQGARSLVLPADVRDGAALEAAVERAEAELGPLAVLVNAAGILRCGTALELDEQDWADTFAVNAGGVFLLSRAVARRMAPRHAGCIVTVGSNAAAVPRMQMSAYAASKAASAQFTKCLGLELAGQGIRCNVVSPGSTDTPMQRALWQAPDAQARVIAGSLDTFRAGIPLGRIATPDDIAEAVIFLCSDSARHITLHDLCVDGGAALGA
ncbi:2,3-dihydro-2,3-dihydroxybenzoate dehydrogenase [Massilia sp. BJB1822]|uniref:2,3-dihydro-2,3-dihydroxybenzoate dehydrogenase n=1 Tax=Massilia sp. BJB1822 TaxID=2744470 RepID=UPI001593DE85|nr:2,3-dihydro-2,3-dihydroxybenzoate dehydrogenase [Massilia sp. BJB1822]NVE00066.1 2,3-dihydro-2,3-dihydroxybenzoate dehydrogenase [Massilia sp. BJB1822]